MVYFGGWIPAKLAIGLQNEDEICHSPRGGGDFDAPWF